MTKYTRLTSETSLIDYIKGLERKIDAQATKGSGDIIVADESGVETVIGTLPDGSVGFEQFVGDTTPPPVAAMPAVSAQPGTFVVTWDGAFEGGAAKPRDFVHVNVIGHKMDGATTVFSAPLGVIRLVTESVLVNLDVAAGGESWQFSLESEDYSGNKAQWGTRTPSYMMLDAISTTDQAWTDLNADVAGKGRTFTQSFAPPIQERLPQNLWIDTSAGPGLYVTKYWDDAQGAWIALKDKDAKAAQDTADAKGVTIYSSTTPAASAQLPQNLWVDTTGGINIQKRWVQGSGWVVIADSRIASNANAVTAADNKAQTALDTANQKGRTYTQATTPPVEARLPQNLWIDTSAGPGLYVTKYWDSTANAGAGNWVALKDKDAKAAQDTADAKGVTIYSDTAPAVSAQLPQNMWVDTTGGINIQKRWVQGSGWVVVSDSRITSNTSAVTAADSKAQTALDTANAKGRTYTQSVAPPVDARLPQNLWIDTSLGVNLSVTKFWDSTANSGAGAWVPVKDQEINAAETRAAADAKAKADAATAAAINAQAYSANPSFDDWTGSMPVGYAAYGTGPTKETSIFKKGPYSARFNCTDTTTSRGLSFSTLSNAPDIEYWTIEVSFQLVSGTSLSGAAVRLDWTGMTVPAGQQPVVKLADEVPAPITGKWYTITKTVRKNPNTTGTYTGMSGYLFANFSSYGPLTVKDIIFDWLNIRPASVSEILAYTAPTTQYVDQAKSDAITAASNDASTKANQAKTDAIADTDTKLTGKNKVVWSPNPASGTTGFVAGDTWFQRDGTGAITAQWEWVTTPSAGWQSRTVSDAVLGNISAGKITSGVIDSTLIAANSISATQLFIGDFENLSPELGGVGNWSLNGVTVDAAVAPFEDTKMLTYANPAVWSSATTSVNTKAKVSGGDQLAWQFRYKKSGDATVSGTLNLRLLFEKADGTLLQRLYLPSYSAATTGLLVSGSATVFAGSATVRLEMVVSGATAGTTSPAYIGDIQIRRMVAGSLIVDGAIDGKTITGATIQTEQTANRGIKLTSTEFSGYDTSGNKNFSLTSSGTLTLKGSLQSGSTIAGATITGALETTATASRGVKLSNTGIQAWDGSGNPTFVVDATTGQVEVPGLKASSIKGTMIEANTIGVDKLLVMSMDNLISEPTFTAGGTSWAVGGAYSIDPTGARNSGPAWKIVNAASQQGAYNKPDRIPVEEGQSYRMIAYIKSDVSIPVSGVSLYAQTRTATGALTAYSFAKSGMAAQEIVGIIPANTWTKLEGTRTVPAGHVNISFGVYSEISFSTGSLWVDFVSVTRAANSQLIVDGSIDGKTITGATIQTIATASRGIKLTSAELAGYDGSGVKNFSLTSAGALTLIGAIKSGSTIEGASLAAGGGGIVTSTSANTGVKIADTGIKAYSGGNLTFHLDSTTGLLEVPGIKTNSLKGDTIIAQTLAADRLLVSDFTNLLDDPSITGLGWTKGSSPNSSSIMLDSSEKTNVWKFTAASAQVDVVNKNVIPVNVASDLFYLTVRTYSTLNSSGLLRVLFCNETGSVISSSDITVPASGWTNRSMDIGDTVPYPTGTKYLKIQPIISSANTSGYILYGSMALRRKNGGELIVDGAIDGKIITGALIQTVDTPTSGSSARGIKMTTTELMGFDGAGNKNFSLTSAGALTLKGTIQSGSSIQGASLAAGGGGIETSTAANTGVKLQNTGIKAYDGTDMTFSVDAATGIVDAPGIRTNSLSGDKIIAKSMTLDKLVVTSTDNLVMEGDFSNLGASWQLPANLTINATAGRGSLPAMRLTGTTSTVTTLNFNDRALNIKNKISIDSGDRFHGSMWVKSTATAVSGSYKIVGRFYTTATAYTDITIASSPALVANVWTNVEAIVPNTIPTGVIAAEWYLSLKNSITGTITDIDFVSVTKASTGALIVDGAIDGKVITGAIIQTAPSGARIVLDDTSLNAWNTAGDNYFNMTDADGVNISSKGKAGYTLNRTNYCTNPTMGAGITGWTSAQTEAYDTTLGYSGTSSLKVTHTATADRIAYRLENIPNLGNYRFSVYVRHNAATAKTVTAKLYWVDSANVPMTGVTSTFTGTATSVNANTWTRLNIATTGGTPANAYQLRLEVVGTAFTSTETLWVDAAMLEYSSTTFGTLGSYFDGNFNDSSTTQFEWSGTANASYSYEQKFNNITIKSGGNSIVVPDISASKLAPGIGFIPATPYAQTAGLFSSDGQQISLIEGGGDPQVARIDVGTQTVGVNGPNGVTLDSGGQILLYPGGASQVYVSGNMEMASGTMFNGLSIDKDGATSLTFSNGWTHFGGGYGNCQVREVSPGVVTIQGMAKPGTKTDGVVIAVLPAEFRPNRIQNIGITVRTSKAAPYTDNVGLLSINPNGNVSIYANDFAYVSYATITVTYFLVSP